MEFQITLYSLIYFLAGLTMLIPVWTGWRVRKYPGVPPLFLMMFFIWLWAFFCTVEMSLVRLEMKQLILVLEDFTFLAFNGMLCLFILDYFSLGRWLAPVLRRWMWLIPGVILVLDLTNSWHGLVWKAHLSGPPGSNLLLLTPGPVYFGVMLVFYPIYLALLIIAGYFAISKSSKVRIQARFIFIGILFSWLSQVLYVIIPDQALGLSLLPIGFSVCGMLISWVVFEDLLSQSHTLAMELKASRDNLSARLVEQQQKVSGMYDLVYLNADLKDPKGLIKDALRKMKATIGCDAAAYFSQMDDQYILNEESGMGESQRQQLTTLAISAASSGPDVLVWTDAPGKFPLPGELHDAGFQSAAAKLIHPSAGMQDSIFYLWQDPHPFQVDEIALMGAQADVFNMIIENERSRRLLQELAALEERKYLGRELHDRISQDLFSLSIFGANSIHHARAGMSAALFDDLNTINILAQQVLNEMRLLLFDLQAHRPIDVLPLDEAIQRRFAIVESHVNIQTNLVVDGCDTLPPPIAKVLYGVVIEALNNIVKYAKAKAVSILVRENGGEVRLEIRDDGVGFNPRLDSRRGLGLENMRQRVEQVEGTLQITSEIGHGTFIQAVLPIPGAAAAAVTVSAPPFQKEEAVDG
jgi:signal transduction histidine kinase